MIPQDWIALAAIVAATIVIPVVAVQLSKARRAGTRLTAGQDYRGLAEEFRRLSDMAITAQEHVDLRLTDLGVQVDSLRGQLDRMQRILTEVE
jgi:hypothetical protein